MAVASHRLPITIRLESFEGPLDLLLYLIQSHELDISTVSIGKITDQYLAYVLLMQELNFDIASDFLVMAATLLHWKSKALLPQEKDPNAANAGDEDAPLSQEELIRQLQMLERFRRAGEDLAELPKLGEDVFTRPNRKPPVEKVWREMDITQLALCYQDTLVRARKRSTILKKETVSLTDKIRDFKSRLPIGKLTELARLMAESPEKNEVVVTFLASLELGRLKKLRLHQNETYAPIYLELLESLENFDERMASGFDSITQAVQVELGLADAAAAAGNAEPADRAAAESGDAAGASADLRGDAGTRTDDLAAGALGGAEAGGADFGHSGSSAHASRVESGAGSAAAGGDGAGAGFDLESFTGFDDGRNGPGSGNAADDELARLAAGNAQRDGARAGDSADAGLTSPES
jgi:segregation and condensation protein A